MKGMFPQYDELDPARELQAWKQGLFVFDTNVLLNLYRYRANARYELIEVLGRLGGRIWIPHHVALEFQRNRLKVIAEQSNRFSDVRKTIEKAKGSLAVELDKLQLHKRHSLIDPQPLLDEFTKLATGFLSRLEELRTAQQGLTDPDPLKKKIEALFEGRVGDPPESQAVIDKLYEEGAWRFKAAIPPGYRDIDKDKHESDEHYHAGILYKKKYADFLIWRQITTHAKSVDAKQLVFVTDDAKEDWWQKIEADGPKTIGPRPELIEEARVHGGVTTFLMYGPEGFLKYAGHFLKAHVSEETLREVRDVSIAKSEGSELRGDVVDFMLLAQRSVREWLMATHGVVEVNRRGFPGFIVVQDGKRHGYVVKVIWDTKSLINRIFEATFALREMSDFATITVMLVFRESPSAKVVERAQRVVAELPGPTQPVSRWLIGMALADQGFVPLHEIK